MPTYAEIDAVMNKKSLLMGNTGSPQLDLLMSSAEQSYQRAQAQCNQLQPLIKKEGGDFVQQAMGLISGELANARQFLAGAAENLSSRKRRAESGIKASQTRPDVSDEILVARIHSLETLLDSLNTNKIIPRIEEELKSGDELSKYICRGAEDWLPLFLESRQIPYSDLVTAIMNTTGVLETTLSNSCIEYLTVENLLTAFEKARKSIESSFQSLPLEVLSWVPKRLNVNSLESLPDDHPVTMRDLRTWLKTPH
jgi:hypothetical protein